MIIATPAENRK